MKSKQSNRQPVRAHAKGRREIFRLEPSLIHTEQGWNERRQFNGIESLARSMHQNGQQSPVHIRRGTTGHPFLLVAGERRWRAANHIRQHFDPGFLLNCTLEPPHTKPIDRLFTQLEENSGVPFTMLEKGRLYARARAAGASQTEIAARTQETKQAVSQALKLVDFGAPKLLRMVELNQISATLASSIIAQAADHARQLSLASAALDAAAASGKGHATPKHLPKPAPTPPIHPSSAAPSAGAPVGESDPAGTGGMPAGEDPAAIRRIKASPSTNRDGSAAGPGSGGFSPPDKQLAKIDKLLDDLAAKSLGHPDRIITTEIVLRFIHNECPAKTLKDYLIGFPAP